MRRKLLRTAAVACEVGAVALLGAVLWCVMADHAGESCERSPLSFAAMAGAAGLFLAAVWLDGRLKARE